MNIVQVLIPLWSNLGEQYTKALFDEVREEFVDQFSGLTAYTQAPVSGLWQNENGETVKDQLLIYEVMVEELDLTWWADYKSQLERRFDQEELVIRAQKIRFL